MKGLIVIFALLLPVSVTAQGATQNLADAGRQTAAPSKSASAPPERPSTEGSMVGYIEDAIIASQVRIRFDAAWRDSAPDMAEFFYGKCGCYRGLPSNSPAYDPNAPGPGPGIVTDVNYQQLYLRVEFAPTPRFSAFGEVPVRWLQPKTFVPGTGTAPKASGLSDVQAGVKLGLIADHQSSLTFQFKTYFASGDAATGLGTGHASIEPSLLYYRRLDPRASLELMFGLWHPVGGSSGIPTAGPDKFAGNVLFYGIGPSYEVYRSDRLRVAPVVELVGWSIRSGFSTRTLASVAGTNIVNLKLGARTSFGAHQSVYVGYGRGLTGMYWYKNLFRLEYRYAF